MWKTLLLRQPLNLLLAVYRFARIAALPTLAIQTTRPSCHPLNVFPTYRGRHWCAVETLIFLLVFGHIKSRWAIPSWRPRNRSIGDLHNTWLQFRFWLWEKEEQLLSCGVACSFFRGRVVGEWPVVQTARRVHRVVGVKFTLAVGTSSAHFIAGPALDDQRRKRFRSTFRRCRTFADQFLHLRVLVGEGAGGRRAHRRRTATAAAASTAVTRTLQNWFLPVRTSSSSIVFVKNQKQSRHYYSPTPRSKHTLYLQFGDLGIDN